ncbi:hypothetical protein C7271_22705 [filamentous cyanobacterium CCP5]|nr:hypothetical protein C7271_22705 [filamentous cyanobacterium CCP5]
MSSLRPTLLLGLLALTACSNRLDSSAVEAAIKADIERQGRRLTLREVRCPTNILRQAEAYFRCVGELEPEGTFPINVIQQDSQGNVTWEVPNSAALLNLVSVENEIQTGLAETFSKRAYVDCGSEMYRPNQAGDRFECQIVGGLTVAGDRLDSVLVRVTPEGDLEWQEQRQSVGTPDPSTQANAEAATTDGAASAAAPANSATVAGPAVAR